jgi:hypothetical protein
MSSITYIQLFDKRSHIYNLYLIIHQIYIIYNQVYVMYQIYNNLYLIHQIYIIYLIKYMSCILLKTNWCLGLMVRATIMSGRHRFKCYRNYKKKKNIKKICHVSNTYKSYLIH